MADPAPTLVVRGLTKRFGGITALSEVDLDVHRGEVVGLVGENGAGKSTLVNVLSGMCRPDGGTIVLDDTPVKIDSPGRARALGIATVFQGLALCENLDVVKNLFLGREIGSFWMDEPAMERQSAQIVQLRSRGLGVIMISHDLDDLGAVADRVVVLRHGRNNGVFDVASATSEQVHQAMTGSAPGRGSFGQATAGRHEARRSG